MPGPLEGILDGERHGEMWYSGFSSGCYYATLLTARTTTFPSSWP